MKLRVAGALGHSWPLYHSVGQPDTFLERFTVPSWTESERLEYDTDGVTTALGIPSPMMP
ncbi:hypothetical protein A5760_04245 [Mycobacterium colombiense]|uniref:Uncharacterized protein n=1 Tax=Mycobacterium colombiense TaxID=339268 RepID=A0A1A0VTS5_9MYCO|nr:hypothetical protein [Mycobacterium colombiense]OBB86609.1 hypothetical protein A5760_04245 [Mycobacterium colombiense]